MAAVTLSFGMWYNARPVMGRVPLSRPTGVEPPPLARKPNYDFEKRRKEMERKAKKDAKREERLQRTRDATAQEAAEAGQAGSDEPIAPIAD